MRGAGGRVSTVKEKDATTVTETVAAYALSPFVTALRGVVLTWYWLWFAVPLGLPMLTLSKAIGLSLLVSLLVFNINATHETKRPLELVLRHVWFSLFAWGVGALWHWWLT